MFKTIYIRESTVTPISKMFPTFTKYFRPETLKSDISDKQTKSILKGNQDVSSSDASLVKFTTVPFKLNLIKINEKSLFSK